MEVLGDPDKFYQETQSSQRWRSRCWIWGSRVARAPNPLADLAHPAHLARSCQLFSIGNLKSVQRHTLPICPGAAKA